MYAQQVVHKDGPCPQMPLVAPVACSGTPEEAKAFLLDRLLTVAPAMAPKPNDPEEHAVVLIDLATQKEIARYPLSLFAYPTDPLPMPPQGLPRA